LISQSSQAKATLVRIPRRTGVDGYPTYQNTYASIHALTASNVHASAVCIELESPFSLPGRGLASGSVKQTASPLGLGF
jgi:hypothetical protein